MKKFKQIFDPAYLKGGETEKGSLKYGWHKNWKEKKVFKFTWDYCGLSDCMFVRCPKCGNNCCNAGFGFVGKKDDKPIANFKVPHKTCDVCNLAYQYQDLAYKTKTVPSLPSKKIRIKEKEKALSWSL